MAVLVWAIFEGESVNLLKVIKRSIWKVLVSLKRMEAFPIMITEMIAKAAFEWEGDNYPPTVPNKDFYIPHGNWLKEELAIDAKRKQKSRAVAGGSAQPPEATSSGSQIPITQELGLKILELL
ncbi:hypothetical protein AHAS_Ahas11G0187700 [Arachis hypogaea]